MLQRIVQLHIIYHRQISQSTFKLAIGIVDYYNAKLIGKSQNAVTKNVSHATDRVTFSGLYGDTNYTLTLVTHSGDLSSTPYTVKVTTDIMSKFQN